MRRMRDAQGALRSFRMPRSGFSIDQSSVQTAALADSRDGREPPASGRAGLARSRLLDAVPQAEDP